ncbi:hypothetical protein ACRRTK_006626 [Alexandromys fortis]
MERNSRHYSRDRVTAITSQPLSEGGEGTKDNGDEIRVRVTKAGTPNDRQLGCRGACNKKEATLVHESPYSSSGIPQPVGQKGNLCLWRTQVLTLPHSLSHVTNKRNTVEMEKFDKAKIEEDRNTGEKSSAFKRND